MLPNVQNIYLTIFKCIFPKKWYSQRPKLQKVTAYVLWSRRQKSNIYTSLPKSGTQNHQNPKKHLSLFCDPVNKSPIYISSFVKKCKYSERPKLKKSDLFVFTCFCVSTFAFTSVILAVASRFERCSAFLLTFFFKSGRAGQWRNISKTQPESFFT